MSPSLILLLPVKNLYEATANAVNSDDAMNTRAIVESLGRTRALDLAILCGLFAFHIQAKRSTDSLFALAAILLVRSIAVLYDGLDHDGFKKRVKSMGPSGFTLVNSVPGLITTVLVFRAVIIVSPSPALVVLLVVITPIPLAVHLLCDVVALRLTNQGAENQVELGNIGGRGPAAPQAGVNLTQRRTHLTELEGMLRKERSRRKVARGDDFLNLTSGYQHMRLGESDEAIIHGPLIHDSQPINLQSAIPDGLHTGSDRSFGYIPDTSAHDGTPVPWHQGLSGGGSDPIVGQQQGYIEGETNASIFAERASVGQIGGLGDYVPIEASEETYPTANPARRQILSAIHMQNPTFPLRNIPRESLSNIHKNPEHQSLLGTIMAIMAQS
ncbi:hypothetical protein C8J56DRAFT_1085257 [Mycena floridula]|nr:hypothetical protein C8J56DRAFT_1085257 [Mycena floridula]